MCSASSWACRARRAGDTLFTQAVTALVYLGCWFLMAGIVYDFIGFETRGKSIEQIDKE